MTILICNKENQKKALKAAQVSGPVQIISPVQKRAVHGADKVIIYGDYPAKVKQYTGICPVQIITLEKDEPGE